MKYAMIAMTLMITPANAVSMMPSAKDECSRTTNRPTHCPPAKPKPEPKK